MPADNRRFNFVEIATLSRRKRGCSNSASGNGLFIFAKMRQDTREAVRAGKN